MNWREAISDSLSRLAAFDRLGLITDMDGTISPIVAVPADARPTSRSRDLLADLQRRLALVAVVSGRSAADVAARVGLPQLVYVGNHGLERWHDGIVELAPEAAPYRPHLEAAQRALEPHLGGGIWFEDKGATGSVHYRNAANPEAAADNLRPVLLTIATDHGLRVFQGRMIFELRPPVEVNKGTAFRALVDEYRLDAAIYIGDDTTDADALHMARRLREQGACYAVGVGVESADMPSAVADAADLLASGISDVEAFFSWLLNARSASST